MGSRILSPKVALGAAAPKRGSLPRPSDVFSRGRGLSGTDLRIFVSGFAAQLLHIGSDRAWLCWLHLPLHLHSTPHLHPPPRKYMQKHQEVEVKYLFWVLSTCIIAHLQHQAQALDPFRIGPSDDIQKFRKMCRSNSVWPRKQPAWSRLLELC